MFVMRGYFFLMDIKVLCRLGVVLRRIKVVIEVTVLRRKEFCLLDFLVVNGFFFV